MELIDESPANFNHGLTLLRELNSQRGMGQFCDCIIQLQVQPGRLFLAHKSVLAAFSPVFASLLPHHGVLVDLNAPYLSPETLDILLDYIYTGALPPQSQEEAVFSAARHLQMEQLQEALRLRRKALGESTHSVQDKPSQKRRFVEGQSVNGNSLSSPSYYPYSSDQPVSSSPSCEVVPVICHARRAVSKFPQQAGNASDTPINHSKEPCQYGYPQPSNRLNRTSLLDESFEPAQTKQDKFLAVLSDSCWNDLPEVVAEKIGSRSRSANDSVEPESTLTKDVTQMIAILYSKEDGKDYYASVQRPDSMNDKDLSPETKCNQNRINNCPQFSRCDSSGDSKCLSDADNIQSFKPLDSGKGMHLSGRLPDTFSRRNSYNSSGSTDTNEANCEKRTLDLDTWTEIAQTYAQENLHEGKPLEISTTGKASIIGESQKTDFAKSYEFSQTRTYRGHLRFQCCLEQQHSRVDSSDSDSDRECLFLNSEAKGSSRVLDTTEITGIPLTTRRLSTSSEEHSTSHPFQCSMCERAFSQRGSLNRHMRSHLGVRPYACPQCSMTFSRQYRVTEHMRVHQRSCEDPSDVRLRTASTGMDV